MLAERCGENLAPAVFFRGILRLRVRSPPLFRKVRKGICFME